MKILLLANYLPDEQKSMQRFADVLFAELPKHECEVRVIRPEPIVGHWRPGNQGLAKWLGYFDKFVLFPTRLKREAHWADIVHILDHSNAIYTPHLEVTPHVVTCHDLLAIRSALGEVPENPTRWTGQQLQRMILRGLEHAQSVACVSEKTRADLQRISSITSAKTSVVYMGLNYPYRPMSPEQMEITHRRLGLTQPYLLHVGMNAWYKNRLGVLRIFHALKQKQPSAPKLVMAGAPFNSEMKDFVRTNSLGGKVIELLSCSNEELRALYTGAELLLFPSLEEGFGWPIIEAQACGCRVVTTAKAPMSEVGGLSALYIDPKDFEAAAQAVHTILLEGAAAKLSRIRQGYDNVIRFSTDQMIDAYLQCYRRVIADLPTSDRVGNRASLSKIHSPV